MNEVRIGRVSSVNELEGTVRIAYPDRSDRDTAELPVFCGMGREYRMPQVGEMVLVLHLSNDSSMGIVMGGFWSEDEKPPESGGEVYYKEFQPQGASFLRVISGSMMFGSRDIIFQDASGSISVSELLALKRRVDGL